MPKTSSPDRWSILRDIILPRRSSHDSDEWVCVNGRSFQIPRGQHWQVPLPIAEVLAARDRAEAASDAFRANATK